MKTTHTPSGIDADPRDRLRHRYQELGDVLDGVLAERELSIFLAHRRGVPDTDIVTIVDEDITAIHRIIAEHTRDEHAHAYEEGPSWLPVWPHQN